MQYVTLIKPQLKFWFTVFSIDFRWKSTVCSEKCITQSRKYYKNCNISCTANTQTLNTLQPKLDTKIKNWDEIKKFITTINTKKASKWLVSLEKAL